MAKKMSIVLTSGTVDKMMEAGILASGAVANDMDVEIFVSFWGLLNFKKDAPAGGKVSYDGKEMEQQVMEVFKKKNVPSWKTTMMQAKEVGNVKIYACALMADLMDIKREDLDPMIDEIVGVGDYVGKAAEADITLSI